MEARRNVSRVCPEAVSGPQLLLGLLSPCSNISKTMGSLEGGSSNFKQSKGKQSEKNPIFLVISDRCQHFHFISLTLCLPKMSPVNAS